MKDRDMVLSSQMARPEMTRRSMASRKRRSNKLWLPVLGLAVVVGGSVIAYRAVRGGESPGPAPANAGTVTPSEPEPPTMRFDAPSQAPAAAAPAPTVPPAPAAAAPAPISPPVTASTATPAAARPAADITPKLPAPAVTRVPGSTLATGLDLIDTGKVIEGRRVLSELLLSNTLGPSESLAVRDTLTRANQDLIFSKSFNPNDPLTEQHTVQSGDVINRIAYKYKITGDSVIMINGVNPNRLMVGQKLKVVKGPFHAVVTKSDFRMDLYLTGPDGKRVYVRSFTVGLGANDGTPTGNFIVQAGKKVKNPAWKNPRTGEYYDRDDPKNPIGEYWLALQGTDPSTEAITGYGIHGTTEPESIGKQMSMGCVRLGDADVELIYKLLVDGQSTVTILP